MSMSAIELIALAQDARLRLAKLKLRENAVKICMAGLERMEKVLARPPRVAIVGEVNAGKTSVAELLLGAGILPSSVVANTRVPILIGHAEETALYAITQNGRHLLTENNLDELPSGLQLKSIEIRLPSERLFAFEILDTPSIHEPGAINTDAQMFVWCTVATRAWTESERAVWAAVPRRCWRNALLVATHKDLLRSEDDVAKIERRLRTSTGPMFRDVLFVSAASTAPAGSVFPDGPPLDEGARALLERVGTWAAEISARRARKAERILRHLARLTLHELTPAPLSSEAALILRDWEGNRARLLASLDGAPARLSAVIQGLLLSFAQSLDKSRAGSAAHRSARRAPEAARGNDWPFRSPAARRYAGLIAADLTALLRIDLARWGLQDASLVDDYATARAILLPLADLDAVFDGLGRHLTSGKGTAGPPEVPPRLSARSY